MIDYKRNKTNKQYVMPITYWLALILIFLLCVPAYGEDMRAASRKAKADYEAALAEAR
ncbi:MAG: hypothetical protein JRI41_03530, partial [Deltaproteobacteria bacterium]|nr:hypothetical protein [Deltaproteobacteria bacterium]